MSSYNRLFWFTIALSTQLSLFSSTATATWQLQPTGLPSSLEFANAIDACSDSVVIFGTGLREEKRLYLSSDGGSNWLEIQIEGDSSRFFTDVSIIDSLHFWVVTAYPAKIYSSSDGGVTWDTQYSQPETTEFFDYIEMFDINHGIAMGDGIGVGVDFPAIFLRTENGGASWSSENDTLGSHSGGHLWACVDFLNIDEGFWRPSGCPPEMQWVHYTGNGGNTWTSLGHEYGVQLLKFYNSDIGVTSDYDFVCRTVDGGENWVLYQKPYAYTVDIEFSPLNPAFIWMINGESVLFSADTGRTWEVQFTGLSDPSDLVFPSQEVGWLLDYSGVYHTTNGGIVGLRQERTPLVDGIQNFRIYPNPVNGNATIRFTLSNSSSVSMKVYDIRGAILYDEDLGVKPVGEYLIKWRDIQNGVSELNSGLYLVSIVTENANAIRKMLVIR